MTNDLHFRALAYSLGELTDAEATAFESLMERDQVAREALAEAVLLTAAVREVRQPARIISRTPATREARSSRWAVGAAGLAAAVVVAALAIPARTPVHAEAPAIVEAWNELGADQALFAELDSDIDRDDPSSDVPDWMVAAVLEAAEPAPHREGTL
jgi:hypothetical protein